MSLTEIRAIVFDVVGTLIHPEPPAARVYAEVGARFGSRLSVEAIAGRFAAAFQREEEADRAAGWRTSEERERQRWRTIVDRVLDDVTDPEACFEELFEHFSRPEAWRLDAEVPGLLEQLARRGYALGLASNYDGRLRRVLAGLPVLQLITHQVISSEVGWRKPAVGFFAALGRVVGLPLNQILYVGDAWVNDYEGARAAGLPAVLLDPRGRAPVGVSRVTRLTDLLTCLPPGSPGP
jgi:putative hydrolase of the HAD superfamily